MIKGLDISHWQDIKDTPKKMDFEKAKAAGAEFVYIKVSERGGEDSSFEYHWAAAKAAGLLRGGYHFLRWDLSGLVQARIFCKLMEDDPGELPPAADYEAPPKDGKYPSNSLLEQFLVEVETKEDRIPFIYTSPGYWNAHGRNKFTKQIDQKWSYYPLWVAHYTSNPQPDPVQPWGTDWKIWQYTASGDGIAHGAESKGLDLDWFNGDMAALRKFAGLDQDQPIPDPDPDPDPNPDPGNELPYDKRVDALEYELGEIGKWARSMNYKG